MPRISVVVPIYNVEEFLEPCLESLAAQTVGELDVVMVDDGSTDGSSAIAEAFARRDARFRLVSQENGGLSKARNTGAAVADGEYLAFVDSDDVLPSNAYELLLGALEKTGSDFATGNVHRLTRFGTTQSRFIAKVFDQTRLKTHVTRFRPLLADRTAWNKLWRRSFWDRHGFRFPEGRLYEDIPVTLPAHFLATSVDVIADTVYYWRIREGGALSITQRRLEPRALLDRLAAVGEVSDRLARTGPRGAKRWYDETVVADDLRYFLNQLDAADDAYRELFLERVNAFLDAASRSIYDPLPSIERLKWQLVRRRMMPELLEVLRFQKEELATTPPVRVRGKWYGDYPFRTDRRLRIPRSVYRLEGELTLSAHVELLERDGHRLRIGGYAYINGIGAASRDDQRVEISALRPGPLRRIRLITSAVRARAAPIHRPDVTANARQATSDLSWCGFEAGFDPRALRRAGRWRDGTWELYVTVRAAGTKRRRSKFYVGTPRPLRAVELPVSGDVDVRATVAPDGGVTIDVRRQSATAHKSRIVDGDILELEGELRVPPAARGLSKNPATSRTVVDTSPDRHPKPRKYVRIPFGFVRRPARSTTALAGPDLLGKTPKPALEVRRQSDGKAFRYPLELVGERGFNVRARLADVLGAAPAAIGEAEASGQVVWELSVTGDGRRCPLALAGGPPDAVLYSDDREISLVRGGRGATLLERDLRAIVSNAGWARDGRLELRGRLPAGMAADALTLANAMWEETHAFALERLQDGAFRAMATPAAIASLQGPRPLTEGRWELHMGNAPVALSAELEDRLPLATVVDGKPFSLEMTSEGRVVLAVRRDLDDAERGVYHEQRLRNIVYVPGRGAPLDDAVVYSSFLGRQYSDSPRAIHEELVRRGAPLEHLWIVRDGMCNVPDSARVLREGSVGYYEALARARYVVTNDVLPEWFSRRPGQTCLQTWHGTPLTKRRGRPQAWQYVVSPNRFSTAILRDRADDVLETGYPRADVLARPERAAALRRRLGIRDGIRTVLYAPTYREYVVDRRGRLRLDVRLDVEWLRAAVGDDTVVLFRKHHYVLDAAPSTADGFVRDVSSYPDGTELLLAADVLVTDYSSMLVDFANTGRPMLFFAYDLDVHEFHVDYAATVPGPVVRTTDELADALGDLDRVRKDYEQRYREFRAMFCEFDDGHATARVVDRVFAG